MDDVHREMKNVNGIMKNVYYKNCERNEDREEGVIKNRQNLTEKRY